MPPEVVSLTDAASATSERSRNRSRKYLAVQSLRVMLFLAAVAAPLPLVVRGLLVAAAGLLSLFSVTAANAPDLPEKARAAAAGLEYRRAIGRSEK